MAKTPKELWQRYREHLCVCDSIGLSLDISRMDFGDDFFEKMAPGMAKAYAEMGELEGGAIANPDEGRMVGHYWLRNAALAPTGELSAAIDGCLAQIHGFVGDVHSGAVAAPGGGKFTELLVIGIGGSALGPQFVADALSDPETDKMNMHFFDNTDPDGIDRVVRGLGDKLKSTLAVVVSKSGGTPETRNGMLLAKEAFGAAGLDFAKQAVAITGEGSKLDAVASEEGWLLRIPMWDWVGGRTSELAAVGLFPAAMQGFDIDAMLAGAKATDDLTRVADTAKNPAALLALMWYHGTNGKGDKDMVVLPYKDRLLLFSRYLQQLVMESLGKELDLDGKRVEQGIAVYGNKGSTDQHAYVQQLREGVNNFFATFIRVLNDGGSALEVEADVTAGDYLEGFLQGSRAALYGNGRESMTLTVQTVDARTVGALIALFERAVGLYATLVNVNAYHQPGVEAGKAAAGVVLALQHKVLGQLASGSGAATAQEIAEAIGEGDQVEAVYHLLNQLAANGRTKVEAGGHACDAKFGG